MDDVYSVSKTFLICGKVLGLIPISVGLTSKANWKQKLIDKIQFWSVFSVVIALMMVAFVNKGYVVNNSDVSYNAWLVSAYFTFSSFLPMFINQMWNADNFKQLLLQISLLDEKVRDINYSNEVYSIKISFS